LAIGQVDNVRAKALAEFESHMDTRRGELVDESV
jgi:hypothetical protein